MNITEVLSSFKTEEKYYSILEDKIISKADWEEKNTEEKEYCYVDFGIWILLFKDSWLVSLVDQRIVEEAAPPPFGTIYTVETKDEGLMSFYDYGEAFTCAAIEEYYSDVNPTYTAKAYMKMAKEKKTKPFMPLELELEELFKRLGEFFETAGEYTEGTVEVASETTITFEDLDLYFGEKQKFKLVLKLLKYYWVERNNLSFGFSYIYISYPW